MEQLLEDPAVLRELIMDHYKYPHNHSLVEDMQYRRAHMSSDSCIDDITVQAKITDGRIQDIRFDGVACTISTSSTSIMTDLLKGKTVEEAQYLIDQYMNMVDGKEYDAASLEEAVAMKNVYRQANRIRCATIGWKAIRQLIEESGETDHGE
ncbi:MAG: SUF system NifU family Fe-S cluster assembly protein [Solobacterium sp.]|nr:SUF system NifU family Fe-S cluster assembly protein [Solobacterium sp.]